MVFVIKVLRHNIASTYPRYPAIFRLGNDCFLSLCLHEKNITVNHVGCSELL